MLFPSTFSEVLLPDFTKLSQKFLIVSGRAVVLELCPVNPVFLTHLPKLLVAL